MTTKTGWVDTNKMIRIPPDVHAKLKAHVKITKQPMGWLAGEAIKKYLSDLEV